MRTFTFPSTRLVLLLITAVAVLIGPTFVSAQTETLLYGFSPTGVDGFFPYAGVTFDKAGNLYGTTLEGGPNGAGTVFELTPNDDGTWTHTVLHNFANDGQDGYYPYGGVIFDASGNLYGTTQYGGTFGAGSVYELMPQSGGGWSERVLHSFGSNGSDGEYANSGLIMDNAGNLYGTTVNGGNLTGSCDGGAGCGTVFKLSRLADGSWLETILHRFNNNGGVDGANPWGALAFGPYGSLYGTTATGGTHYYGTVFELTPPSSAGRAWTEAVLHSFNENGVDGTFPEGAVAFDKAGNLYGVTDSGGAHNNSGAVFKLSPNGTAWTESVIYNFGLTGDAALPTFGNLIFDNAGNLYGATAGGGSGNGTVYELSKSASGDWTETMLFRFPYTGGLYPQAGLTFDAEGNLYGTTLQAGANLYGAVFKITP
jgi:uncharacterized repeat protein (TIGR03803 family)